MFMTDAQRIYGAWTQMWNGNLDIADDILSPDFKAHLTADSTQPPAPVMDIASAKAWSAALTRAARKMLASARIKVERLLPAMKKAPHWRRFFHGHAALTKSLPSLV